jgi:hypothetical protein
MSNIKTIYHTVIHCIAIAAVGLIIAQWNGKQVIPPQNANTIAYDCGHLSDSDCINAVQAQIKYTKGK